MGMYTWVLAPHPSIPANLFKANHFRCVALQSTHTVLRALLKYLTHVSDYLPHRLAVCS